VCVVHTSSFNSLPLFIIMPFYFNILTTELQAKLCWNLMKLNVMLCSCSLKSLIYMKEHGILLNMNPLQNIGSSAGQEKMVQEVDKVDNNDDRISISISRKAHDALSEHTKQLNKENLNQRPFTLEEVLDCPSFFGG